MAAAGVQAWGSRPHAFGPLGIPRGRGPASSRPIPRSAALLALGALCGAAGVGYLTAANPLASPAHGAVSLRIAIILVLALAGLYAQTNAAQARMGRRLLVAGLFSCLWLLNGSSDPTAFTLGVICSAAAPGVVCFLVLAHPRGRLRTQGEARFLIVAVGVGVLCWTAALLTGPQPPLVTPLVHCAPHCPQNLLYVGSGTAVAPALKAITIATWLALNTGTFAILLRRTVGASQPARRMMMPVLVAAGLMAGLLIAFTVGRLAGLPMVGPVGTAYVAATIAVPLCIFLGLDLERLFMGSALADFVSRLIGSNPTDVERLMREALHDPTLRIAYRRPGSRQYADSHGAIVDVRAQQGRTIAAVTDEHGRPIAAVQFDRELSDQRRFVAAAGEAAVMWLHNARLEAELAASARQLSESRRRLLEAAVAERQRIERDLHDGAQQRLVGMGVKLSLAQRTLDADPARAGRMLAGIGVELQDTLDEVRSLGNGIYPSVLLEYGLTRALSAACQRSASRATVRGEDVGRYPRAIEAAVYFACLEALQNTAKHAGAGARVRVHLWQDAGSLRFAVSDSGAGFDAASAAQGSGLLNMRDRLEAIGGKLTIDSAPAAGTVVSGAVAVEPQAAEGSRAESPAAIREYAPSKVASARDADG